MSLKKNSSNCDCVIFYDDISDWTIKQIKNVSDENAAVNLIKIPEKFENRLIIDLRWSLYTNYLETHKNEYRQVLLTDVRDVIFQDNLFNHCEKYGQYLMYATEGLKLDEPNNAQWITKVFGNAEYEKIKNNKIICCGTTCGTINEVLIFAHKMETLLKGNNFWGAEQACANYLIYNKLLSIDKMIESDVNDGIILTVGWYQTEIKNNYILSLKKQVSAIVHQYDRQKNLYKLIDDIYRHSDFDVDVELYDLKSKLDIMQSLAYKHQFSLKSFLNLVDNNDNWDGYFNRLVRFLSILVNEETRSLSLELLQQAVSYVIMLSLKNENIKSGQIHQMCRIVNQMHKNQQTIYKPYETYVSNLLFNLIKYCYDTKDFKRVVDLFEILKTFNYKITSEQYLISANANRLLGNKDKALDDYKKALEFVE